MLPALTTSLTIFTQAARKAAIELHDAVRRAVATFAVSKSPAPKGPRKPRRGDDNLFA